MFVYFIIGIALMGYCAAVNFKKGVWAFKSTVCCFRWWISELFGVAAWPIILIAGVYMGIKEVKALFE